MSNKAYWGHCGRVCAFRTIDASVTRTGAGSQLCFARSVELVSGGVFWWSKTFPMSVYWGVCYRGMRAGAMARCLTGLTAVSPAPGCLTADTNTVQVSPPHRETTPPAPRLPPRAGTPAPGHQRQPIHPWNSHQNRPPHTSSFTYSYPLLVISTSVLKIYKLRPADITLQHWGISGHFQRAK